MRRPAMPAHCGNSLQLFGTRCRRRPPSPSSRRTWRDPSGPCRRPWRTGSRRAARPRAAAGSRADRASAAARLQVGLLEAVAAAVAVGELVERRHAGARPPAFDGHDQGLAVERGLAQVGAVRHLAVHLAAVAGPAVTGLAIALLLEQPHAVRDVGGIGRLRAGGGRERERQQPRQSQAGADTRRKSQLVVRSPGFAVIVRRSTWRGSCRRIRSQSIRKNEGQPVAPMRDANFGTSAQCWRCCADRAWRRRAGAAPRDRVGPQARPADRRAAVAGRVPRLRLRLERRPAAPSARRLERFRALPAGAERPARGLFRIRRRARIHRARPRPADARSRAGPAPPRAASR